MVILVLIKSLKKYLFNRKFLLSVLVLVNIYVWAPQLTGAGDGLLQIKFYSVGQGDSFFIKTPLGKNILIDGGPKSTVIGELSNDVGISNRVLDLVILTHPHADHLNGLFEVFGRFKVRQLVMDIGLSCNDICGKFTSLVNRLGVPSWDVYAGQRIQIEKDLEIQILWPKDRDGLLKATSSGDPNKGSIVFLLKYKELALLFTGDIDSDSQEELVEGVLPDIDILKVPHQGAASGLNLDFVKELKPEIAVISVGKNSYGHPSVEVIDGYSNLGIPLLRTDKHGTIRIKSDGFKWWVTSN